jgi:hypothetical protein
VTARKACLLYSRETVKKEGVNVFLKYSTGTNDEKKLYPYTQELFVGNICCDLYYDVPLFPHNNCKPWDINDIPDDIEDDRLQFL